MEDETIERAHLAYMRGDPLTAKRLLEELIERDRTNTAAIDLLMKCNDAEVEKEVAADESRSWLDDLDPSGAQLAGLGVLGAACTGLGSWIGLGAARTLMGQPGTLPIPALRTYPISLVAGVCAVLVAGGVWLLYSVAKCVREQ